MKYHFPHISAQKNQKLYFEYFSQIVTRIKNPQSSWMTLQWKGSTDVKNEADLARLHALKIQNALAAANSNWLADRPEELSSYSRRFAPVHVHTADWHNISYRQLGIAMVCARYCVRRTLSVYGSWESFYRRWASAAFSMRSLFMWRCMSFFILPEIGKLCRIGDGKEVELWTDRRVMSNYARLGPCVLELTE